VAEAAEYVRFRLVKAGLPDTMFSADLLFEIHARTGGVPRLINAVCAGIMEVNGEGDDATSEVLNQIAQELELS
jgi:general secretion pathway protein A